jgi:hypothetical protein
MLRQAKTQLNQRGRRFSGTPPASHGGFCAFSTIVRFPGHRRSDQEPQAMGEQQPGKWVVPNPQIPRTFGIMNLAFGILMFLVGAGYVAITLVAPSFQKQMVVQIEQQQTKSKAERDAKVAGLKVKEEAAKTQEEKDTLKDEREALESNVEPDLSTFNEMMGFNVFSDIRLAIYSFSEMISGMILNVLMVIAGVGLLGLAEWGRRLAITVACWIAMIVVTLVLILPITVKKVQKMTDSIQAQVQAQAKSGGRPAPPMPMLNLSMFTSIAGAFGMIFTALIASIYPALSIWFLTRLPARAACLQQSAQTSAPPEMPPGDLA